MGFNRVGGVDTQIKINQNWQMNAQAVTSETKFSDGTHLAGPAYHVYAERSSRALEFNTMYQDIAPGFNAETGFINRTDIRRFSNFIGRTFHPEGNHLTAHGPRLFQLSLWDHNGTRLNHQLNPSYQWDFQRNSSINIFAVWEHEQLRPPIFPRCRRTATIPMWSAARKQHPVFQMDQPGRGDGLGHGNKLCSAHRAAGTGLSEHRICEGEWSGRSKA